MASIPPTVIAVEETNPGKFSPVTVMVPPDDPVVGEIVIDEPGTLWVSVSVPPPPEVAVTVLVDGMPAVEGTANVVLKPPALSAVVVATVVPA